MNLEGGSFFLMSKVDVNGAKTDPVFRFLKASAPNRGGEITWNFGAYWVVDKSGNVLKRAEGEPGGFPDSFCSRGISSSHNSFCF